MKLNTLLVTLMFGLALTACNPPHNVHPTIEDTTNQPSGFPPTTSGGLLTNCVSPYGKQITFYESHKQIVHPASFPQLTVWQIEDVNGQHWVINEFEIKDYKCTTDKV